MNQADSATTQPLLDGAAVGWLRGALAQVRPGHPWIGAVADPP